MVRGEIDDAQQHPGEVELLVRAIDADGQQRLDGARLEGLELVSEPAPVVDHCGGEAGRAAGDVAEDLVVLPGGLALGEVDGVADGPDEGAEEVGPRPGAGGGGEDDHDREVRAAEPAAGQA